MTKLTDFGDSRALPTRIRRKRLATAGLLSPLSVSSNSSEIERLSVHGTVDFMAPEVMLAQSGKAAYAEAADIYSLGLTMWQILHPGVPMYPKDMNYLKMYEHVLNGARPSFHPDVNPHLRQLIEQTWSSEIEARPSASSLVDHLECLQRQLLKDLAMKLKRQIPCRKGAFTGFKASAHLLMNGYATSDAQVRRVGNALMDAGYLHHVKHAEVFDQTPTSLYYFIDPSVNDQGACRCVQLAQGLGKQQTKRRNSLHMTTNLLSAEEDTIFNV